MSHRNAVALDVFVKSIHATHPKMTIGTYRAGSDDSSDHHPWLKVGNVGVVRAADIMSEQLDALARNLASQLGRHPALGPGAYVIWKRRIISTDRLGEGWRPYNGASPHTDHVHLSLTRNPVGFDSPRAWGPLMTGTATGITGGLTSTRPGVPGVGGTAAASISTDGLTGGIVGLVVTASVLAGAVAVIGIGAARITRRSESRDDTPTVNVTTTPERNPR